MRDTNDMMEDAICEDTMMECSGDGGGLEDLVNLASDIADSAPSIRDAAERLLTLLGVDEDDDASSSEDEGVELDLDDSENEEPQDARLLHQLAASLAQELKYANQNISNAKLAQGRTSPEIQGKDTVQSMDYCPEQNQTNLNARQGSSLNYPQIREETCIGPFGRLVDEFDEIKTYEDFNSQTHSLSRPSRYQQHPNHRHSASIESSPPPYEMKSHSQNAPCFDAFESNQFQGQTNLAEKEFASGLFNFQHFATQIADSRGPRDSSRHSSQQTDSRSRNVDANEFTGTDLSTWSIGWDACALEALRYLVEDEGLPPHHPTVVAMKNHLDSQRARVLAHFAA